MIRGLIFDFDGLILDTEVAAYESWQEIYREHGHELPLSEWVNEIGGAGIFDTFGYLETQVGYPVDRAAIDAQRSQRKLELTQIMAALPGVENYITEAKRLGLKLAVASSSPHSWVDDHLERLGLLHYFDVVKCAEDVERVKPDPALFLESLASLGVAANEAVVFEDSPNGALAANRAGIFCVAIPNSLTGQLPLDHANLRLTSMTDMPLTDLLHKVSEWVGA